MLSLPILIVLVIGLLIFAMVPPRRKPGQPTGPTLPDLTAWQAPAADHRTLRQRQIEEDAALLSSEFVRFEDERYRAEVRDRAGRAFAPSPTPAAAIPASKSPQTVTA